MSMTSCQLLNPLPAALRAIEDSLSLFKENVRTSNGVLLFHLKPLKDLIGRFQKGQGGSFTHCSKLLIGGDEGGAE